MRLDPRVRELIRGYGPDATEYEERIANMGEGNPGALTALCKLVVTQDDGSDLLNLLAEQGVTGAYVWVGFKDHCNGEVDVFAEKIRNEDVEMYEEITEYRELRGEA